MRSIHHHVPARNSAKNHYFLSYEKDPAVIKQGRDAPPVEERRQAQGCLALREIYADIFGHDTVAEPNATEE